MMENIKPMDIEKRSFAIITELLGDTKLEEENELVIKRVIHTTADFDYVQNLVFSPHAVTKGLDALRAGCHIVTDTQMAKAGINKTILGRYSFAIGSNEEAARLSGVNVIKWKIISYALCGMMSGFAAWFMTARLNAAQPSTGAGYEMDAIAACIIGGASMSGGEGSVSGTIIGAFIMSVLINGLRIMSVPSEWQTVVTGAVVIFAVYVDMLRRKKQ